MKIISFSEVRFVRAILEGKKTQTIRPLFGKSNKKWTETFTPSPFLEMMDDMKIKQPIIKKPRFKVGESAKLMFKQRSTPKDSWFCLKCGDSIAAGIDVDGKPAGQIWCINCNRSREQNEIFPKHFATASIESVFEIEMWKLDDDYVSVALGGSIRMVYNNQPENNLNPTELEKLAKRDGFNSAKEMFNWFHKKYNLSKSPKRFAVYRWRLI